MSEISFTTSPLHDLPSLGLTLALLVAMLLTAEVGYRVGCGRHERAGDLGRTHFNAVQASLLALLALLLGFTFSMASVRFDARRQGVIDTANNLGALRLRSGELPEPQRTEFQRILGEYLDQQADAGLIKRDVTPAELSAHAARAELLQRQTWEIVRREAQGANPPRVIETLAGQLTEMQSLLRRRIFAYLSRVPTHVLNLLFTAAIGAAGVVGFSAGLGQHRGRLQTVALAVFVCGTIHVILDLDRPLNGARVDQTPLLHLRAQWESEAAGK
jgi:hypothetical protein